jgi:hypothetical protein
MKTLSIIVIVFVASIATISIFAIIYFTPNIGSNLSPNDECLPTNLDVVTTDYPIKQPVMGTILDGYSLRAVDVHTGDIMLYYADHPICSISEGIVTEISKGTILVEIVHDEKITNSTNEALKTFNFLKIQNKDLKVQFLDVNGYRGVGWAPLEGTELIGLNRTITQDKPTKIPGSVIFYNDHDMTGYDVSGMESLEKLLEIAKTIPR